ncbi:MAG: glycosyltransferase family 2 protein [Candidatus Eisenbacteria bacterium]|nr:glycosyltransferase family 2 protein [Candidatus Eisenbacteria bacterium]
MRQKVGVLIPSYNAGESLRKIAERACSVAGRENVVVVDDGSTDGSVHGLEDSGVKVLTHEKNKGKGAALITGFNYFLSKNYDGVVTMDSDGQHDPSYITSLIEEAARTGAEIVIGTRSKRKSAMPIHRRVGNAIGSLLISLAARAWVPDSQSGFRFLSKDVLSAVKLKTKRYETESELIIKASRMGFKLGTVPIPTVYASEKSMMNPMLDSGRICFLALRSLFWRI